MREQNDKFAFSIFFLGAPAPSCPPLNAAYDLSPCLKCRHLVFGLSLYENDIFYYNIGIEFLKKTLKVGEILKYAIEKER